MTSVKEDKDREIDLSERLNKLQGNLRFLEREYRANLKDGFDQKIKAYRLEAVVERKLLKEALDSVKKSKEHEYILSKRRNSQYSTL